MAHGSGDQVASNWSSRLGASTERIRQGVQAVTTSPGQMAARQQDVWAANVAASKGKWAAAVSRVTVQDWQSAMLEKGLNRIASGAAAAESKFAAFMNQFLPHLDRVRASLPARGGLEQNIARMTAQVRGAAAFKRS